MKNLLRVMLDTNVYSTLFEQGRTDEYRESALQSKVAYYGFSVIRKELRAIPKEIRVENQNFRSMLLDYYDMLVGSHEYGIDKQIEKVAYGYAHEYSGGISIKKMWNDFLIVACASTHGLDIIVSNDQHSMNSALAQEAYVNVNRSAGLSRPQFKTIHSFEKILRPV